MAPWGQVVRWVLGGLEDLEDPWDPEDPIHLGPTRWDQVDQWDQVVLVGLVQEGKDLATE